MFFAASGSISGRDGSNVARVPNFRGLIWVACDDELSSPDPRRRIYHPSPSFQQSPIHNTAFLHHSGTDEDDQLISSSDDDYDSSSETTSDDLETFAPMPMDIDLDLASDPHSPNSPAIANPDTIHARMELDPALQGESPVPVLPDTKEFSPKGTLHHHGAHMHPVNQRTQPDNGTLSFALYSLTSLCTHNNLVSLCDYMRIYYRFSYPYSSCTRPPLF